MKILLVTPYFAEPYRWMVSGQKTAYELSKKHQTVVVTTGSKTISERVNKNFTLYRIKDIFLPDPINYSFIPNYIFNIKKIIRKENPEAVLINKHMFYSSLSIFAIKRLGYRVIVQTDTFPGINWFPRNKLIAALMWLYAKTIGGAVLRAADKVILLHEGLIKEAKKLKLNFEIVHSGVDLTEFDSIPTAKDLPKKNSDTWIGYVGRLESVKGWYDLAEVAVNLVKQNRRLNFFFVGPTENVRQKIKEFFHPNIHFLGFRRDIPGIVKLIDIFVMPSYSEGLSNAIMEAMAAGCCCLASKAGGNVVLIQDQVSGRLFEKGDQSDLKNKLNELINDPMKVKRLGERARKVIEADFDLSKNVAKIVKILNQ